MSATVSLLGLSRINPGILGEIVLPDGLDADLVKDNLLAETAENDCEYYGVKITDGREDAALRNITVSQRNIQSLGALLVDFSVTPMTLRDVVEDWLARN